MLDESFSSVIEPHPRVLIVDDDDDTRVILSEMLVYYGYDPLIAADGKNALVLATNSPPDVALVDILLPDLSGLDVTAQLRHIYPQLPIIIMTVLDTDDAQEIAHRHNVFAYLIKPVHTMDIVKVIRQALHKVKA